MSALSNFLPLIALSIISLVAYQFGCGLLNLGINRRVYNHVPGECTVAGAFEEGIAGMDTTVDGIVLISTGQDLENRTAPTRAGSIFGLSTDNKSSWELTRIGGPEKLNPGPISLSFQQKRQQKNQKLFLINYRKRGDSVERYKVHAGLKVLQHEATVRSPHFADLRGVAAVDDSRFYATRYTGTQHRWVQKIEKLFAWETGQVLFYDGATTRIVDATISSPAGIAFDLMRRYLYVASHLTEQIVIYQVLVNYELQKLKSIPLKTMPYSLWVDVDGTLVTTAHPIKIRHFYQESNPQEIHAPTQILRVHPRPRSNQTTKIEQLYANDGASISSATVAVRTADQILMGSPFSALVTCQIPLRGWARKP
ncbi:unnamed protein product, partial [Mesorhabditis spiculigera]